MGLQRVAGADVGECDAEKQSTEADQDEVHHGSSLLVEKDPVWMRRGRIETSKDPGQACRCRRPGCEFRPQYGAEGHKGSRGAAGQRHKDPIKIRPFFGQRRLTARATSVPSRRQKPAASLPPAAGRRKLDLARGLLLAAEPFLHHRRPRWRAEMVCRDMITVSSTGFTRKNTAAGHRKSMSLRGGGHQRGHRH